MLNKIVIFIILAIVVFVGLVYKQPAEFRITRWARMSATPAAVFTQVNDLHKWNAWSPWAKMDPTAKNSFEGPAAGPGAIMRWSGNRQVGEGQMTITESVPNQRVRLKLEFLKPMVATHTGEFTFNVQGKQTLVTWTMYGANNFIGKAMGLVINCDKMVGGQFEQGLASMKAIVEAAPVPKTK